MKLTFNTVIIDLETTKIDKSIIEIGAVFLDRALNIVDTFTTLVNPQKLIESEITQLTGITNDMVCEAPKPLEALKMFEEWVLKYSEKHRNARLAAWGSHFDANVLHNTYSQYGAKYPFSATWIDVKTLSILWHMLSGRNQSKTGVENSMLAMNICVPHGTFHRARFDAMCETLIMKRVIEDLSEGFFIRNINGSESKYVHISV